MLSLILPTIRTELVDSLIESIKSSIDNYEWEIIPVGPHTGDYSHPTVCIQKAAQLAKGDLMVIICDDALFKPNSLKIALEEYHQKCTDKDWLCLRYTEGPNHTGDPNVFGPDYWTVWLHPWHHAPGVPMHFRIGPISIMKTGLFRELGGLDCNFETMSLCPHDLAYRIQHNGGIIHLSDDIVLTLNHTPYGNHAVIQSAFNEKDLPYYRHLYNIEYNPPRIKIPYDNWKQQPEKWIRRFGV